MKDYTKHSESSQLSFSDLLCESRVEIDGNTEVRSVLSSSDNGQDGVSKYVPDLLDLILDRKNMSLAYKRVKRNKGSCGIDGMSVDKLYTHLKENGSLLIQLTELERVVIGWVNYFAIADFKGIAHRLDEWLRRRIRMCFWKQWKKTKTKRNNLVKLGLKANDSWKYANTRKSYWRIALSPILNTTLNNNYLRSIGFQSILDRYLLKH